MSRLLWRLNERSQFQRVSGDDYGNTITQLTHLLQFPGEAIVMSQKTETSIIAMPSEVVIVLTSTVPTIFSARCRSMLLEITSNRSESDLPKSILLLYRIRPLMNEKMPTMLRMSER